MVNFEFLQLRLIFWVECLEGHQLLQLLLEAHHIIGQLSDCVVELEFLRGVHTLVILKRLPHLLCLLEEEGLLVPDVVHACIEGLQGLSDGAPVLHFLVEELLPVVAGLLGLLPQLIPELQLLVFDGQRQPPLRQLVLCHVEQLLQLVDLSPVVVDLVLIQLVLFSVLLLGAADLCPQQSYFSVQHALSLLGAL
eukprot:CAMPEP_0201281136 /NCGR_PEP_ID=MMETSP1317-20130820/1639_1 /ASSEMBLY_ACC=CAM_ASM_000770 /TAXON_ID=187299 /ORGANISM="Undescribed Undescribed, Strain Undescribed" /LENGTH=193 /DNA_ID=CAMNT_0047590239 /DNA_START=1174 /DNA_END=1755 /DNA_ORIENTATION=-